MEKARRTIFAIASLLFGVHCAKAPAPATTPAVASDPIRGSATYSFLFDPSGGSLSLGDDEQFVRPSPIGTLSPPEYPERPLAASAGAATIAVRIVIGPEGNVVQVGDSPMLASTPGLWAAEFRGAVERAVRAWRFTPGEIRKTKPGNDLDGDGKADYKVMIDSDTVPVYYDVRFDFEIVDGKGTVRRGDLVEPVASPR